MPGENLIMSGLDILSLSTISSLNLASCNRLALVLKFEPENAKFELYNGRFEPNNVKFKLVI